MFLAHFSGWSYTDLMEMDLDEIAMWYKEAVDCHNYLNKPAD